ncbi:MAG: glycosyltransferase family protein [Leucobacter sp.]
MPKMIFHVPYPLNPAATSASGIRPVQMRRAFETAGYEVAEVSGDAKARRAQIRDLKKRIAAGEDFEFVYSEASTKPTAMTESHSLPLHPFMDISFLSYCKKHEVPVGVFYRDIYWDSPKYLETVPRPVAAVTRALYRHDLKRYRTAVSKIFVPSMRMAAVMPHTEVVQCVALPPGSPATESATPDTEMSLLYVGGTGSYYRMEQSITGVEAAAGARLTICTRENEWEAARESYSAVLGSSTSVVHVSGADLEPLYEDAHLGMLFMEPIGYREFAAPMKLYEYLGHGKPIIATEGSLAGNFVVEHGVGWALPYTAEALTELLLELQENPEKYEAVRANALRVRESHTWEARARQAAAALLA